MHICSVVAYPHSKRLSQNEIPVKQATYTEVTSRPC